MLPFLRRKSDPHALAVGMAGVKLGDRIVLIGCGHGGRLAAIARHVGLSGRAVAVAADPAAARRVQRAALKVGVLVEVEVAAPTRLPFDDCAFDLALFDDTAHEFGALRSEDRVAAIREAARVLRPGGRVLLMGAVPRGGLGALLPRRPGPQIDYGRALAADGFTSPRTLAERDGLVFVEAVKLRQSS